MSEVFITNKEPGDSNYTTFLTNDNIASGKNIGLSASYNRQLKKGRSFNAFINVYNNRFKGIIDNENIHVNYTAYSANFSSQFTLRKGWAAEINGWYNSKTVESGATISSPMGMFSFGGSKKLLKDKASVILNVRDPFYFLHYRGHTDLNKGITDVRSYWDNRRVIFTLTYRFGKSANQQQRQRRSAAEDEKNRINTGGGN